MMIARMPKNKVVRIPSYNVTPGDAILIMKDHLDDPEIALQSKLLAIEKVAEMETHNSITKDDIIRTQRWIFEHYEF